MWLGLCIAVIYGAVAVFANFVNKYAVQVFPLPVTILLTQTLTTVIVLRAMAALEIISVPPLRAVRVQQLASLSICYSLHAVLVLYSLAFLSVPMYNTLKRLTPVMVLAAKVRWGGILGGTETAPHPYGFLSNNILYAVLPFRIFYLAHSTAGPFDPFPYSCLYASRRIAECRMCSSYAAPSPAYPLDFAGPCSSLVRAHSDKRGLKYTHIY
ncbi:hypothetical protein VaNZ11_016904 [Volvox africanus]|uniref:Uncharacterized protein n=1 Tax=Volvox africanus TaxID=51714 RepID=A0ABQ5SRB9_9CHLO|nr:hypothetical protein VaNZ11_016904 [Volvox africanus]